MALDFPAGPHPDGFQWEAPNNVTYTWRNGYWTGVNDEAGVVLQEPVIRGVAIQDQNTAPGRFTSEQFLVNADADMGRPEATIGLKVEITEDPVQLRALTRPSTTEITDVETVPFADGFEVNSTNDNSWSRVIWAGPPWNCYIANGGGSSEEHIATSTDGQNWTRHIPEINGSPSGLSWIVYSPLEQRLYTFNTWWSGATDKTYLRALSCDDWSFNFTTETENCNAPGSGAPSSHYGWSYFEWDYVNNCWFFTRVGGANSNRGATIRGAVGNGTFASQTYTTWGSGNSTNQFLNLGGSREGGASSWATWTASGSSPHGVDNSAFAYWCADRMGGATQTQLISGRHVPTTPLIRCGTASGSYTWAMWMEGQKMFTQTADTPAYNAWTENYHNALFPDSTYMDIQCAVWIDDLNLAVMCGRASTADRDQHGVVLTSSDGITWQRIWTNMPGDDSQYRWRDMWWNTDRQELVLVADNGTNPSMRMGYTQTIGQFLNLPQLTFISADGLRDFAVGEAVDQSDGNTSGVVAAVDVDNQLMVVKGTPDGQTWGPANTGLRVLGPVESYDPAYAIFDADGNVTRLSQFDPGFQQMNGQLPLTLQFPANFEGGNQPDADIPAGSRIRAELQLTSSSNGFTSQTQEWSPTITPT